MRAINLLPKQAVRERSSGLGGKLPFVGSIAVPVVALVLVFVGYSSGHSAVTTKQTQLAAVTAQITAAEPAAPVAAAPPIDTAGLVALRSARLSALQSVLADEVPWDTTLVDMARVLPANVWLNSLTAQSPTPADVAPVVVTPPVTTDTTSSTTTTPAPAPAAPAAPTTGFTIQGSTYTQADVAAMLARLQLLPSLTNVSLVSTSQQPVGDKTLIQFNVTASLQAAPVSQP